MGMLSAHLGCCLQHGEELAIICGIAVVASHLGILITDPYSPEKMDGGSISSTAYELALS
jgi:hypothetical protein